MTGVHVPLDRRRIVPVVATALLLGLGTVVDVGQLSTRWQLPAYLTVSALAVAALVRRSTPLAVGAVAASFVVTVVSDAVLPVVAGDPTSVGDSPGIVELAALLLLLVQRWRVAAGLADRLLVAATVAVVLVLPLRTENLPRDVADSRAVLDNMIIFAGFLTVAVTVGVALRAQDARRRTAVAQVRRDERAEIARELHDVVAHHVTGIVVATQGARVVAAQQASPQVDAALRAIEDSGAQALAAMRTLVGVLRTEVDTAGPSPVPAIADLDELVDRFRALGAVGHVELDVLLDDPVPPGPELQAAAYRVAQEALTNASRHAPGAADVRIAVASTAGAIEVEVTNSAGGRVPPPGEQSARGGGFGLVGMRERVEALGGSFSARSRADGGWTVHARMPLRAPRAAEPPVPAEAR